MTTTPPDSAHSDSAQEIAAALDMLLTQAALGPVRRFLPAQSLARFAWAMAGQPGQVATRAGSLAAELARIARGSSGIAAPPRDRRFTDPAWTSNPALRRVVQAYLASGTALLGLVEDIIAATASSGADSGGSGSGSGSGTGSGTGTGTGGTGSGGTGTGTGTGSGGTGSGGTGTGTGTGTGSGSGTGSVPLDWRDAERIRFAAANLVEALAPSNNALLSPVAWKAAIDTGGGSIVSGTRHLLSDLASAPRVPSMVPPDAYVVGTDLATTPGAVVARTPVFELLQYQPATETVREVPLLIVPPTINKYYILDLAPGRSLVEYLVSQGQQVFVISWRNPDARHASWGFDSYVQAILDAMDATAAICGAEAVHLLSACSGGILSGMAAAVLRSRSPAAASTGDDGTGTARSARSRLASLGLLVTMLDQARSDAVGALVDGATAEAAIAASARKGYLDGRKLAEAFAWLRPSDLVWNYWVNNYLQGREPARFDILYWNADTTRMTAGLHRDFVRAAMDNALARPGGLTVLGTETDLAQVDVDCYAVAGVADHICPWQSCYRGSQLLGGKTRFVLSTSGHIAALVNPADNLKARYQASDDTTAEADEWQRATPARQGSWWPDYASWLAERSGGQGPAPQSLGGDGFRVLEPAPGSYVHAA